MNNAIEVSGLQKRYGERTIVDQLEFHVAAGEVVSLLGPNGAGKSTTIEILEGFRGRDGGEVQVLGVDPAHPTGFWRSRLGIVLQDRSLNEELTADEMLRHFSTFYPQPRRVTDVLELVGLSEHRDQRVAKLSGGQQRRLEVGLGVIGRPDLLFLDEPTTGFDPEARRDFWELIRGLKAEGTTILLTTHYLDEAAQLSDRAGVIAGGKLIDIGTIDEIGGADARIPVVRWTDQNGVHEERTAEPASVVARLLAITGSEPTALEVRRPSLEDVYLGLVAAHTVRQESAEELERSL